MHRIDRANSIPEVSLDMQVKKILIANRGEVVVRVAAACRKLGILTVAIYSDVDRDSAHVKAADEAVHVGASEARSSYLDIGKIVHAAQSCGADAIHPGFGFLSESVAFAEACAKVGLRFIGPPIEAMRSMASKAASKAVARAHGVPVIPGYDGENQSLERLRKAAGEVGFPLLIKASSGGGGIGMRVVTEASSFDEDLSAAQHEARAAFGDERVLIERYFPSVRHVEVQIIADAHGNVLHAFERECSIQRRRQKVVEEAPSPFLTPQLRQRMTEAAVALARAVNYESLGTVEFIVEDEPDAKFYFLEMNTRLQVEHGITEQITGLDLVALQIQIAMGEPLRMAQSDIAITGHAIEVRLYAEDPRQDFMPSTGTVAWWAPASGDSVRVDSGIDKGSVVSSYYDPMLAKLITTGANRRAAIRLMQHALARTVLLGPTTNQNFLRQVLDHPSFAAGDTHTRFVDRHAGDWAAEIDDGAIERASLVAAWALTHAREKDSRAQGALRTQHLISGDRDIEVSVRVVGGETVVCGRTRMLSVSHVRSLRISPLVIEVRAEIDGHQRQYVVALDPARVIVHAGESGTYSFGTRSRFARRASADAGAGYSAMMPGRIVEVLVKAGEHVTQGARLVVMESMKLEHATLAATDGTVTHVYVAAGDNVEAGKRLVDVESKEAS